MNDASLRARFPRFVAVGGIGFVVDAAILQTLFVAGLGPFVSRLFSVFVAMTTTWYLSRRLVFRTSGRRGPEYLRHLIAQSVGTLVNLGVYTGLLLARPALQQTPVVALVVAAIVAMFFNFASATFWTYRDHSQE